MAQGINPATPHHLPPFITAPGQTDAFMVGCAIFLVVAAIGLGGLYFRLHALPEHLAHGKASKLQFEVVAVLALLALFTHNSWFWVAALLLAIVPLPDVYSQIERMADSLATMAGWRRHRSLAAAFVGIPSTAQTDLASIPAERPKAPLPLVDPPMDLAGPAPSAFPVGRAQAKSNLLQPVSAQREKAKP